MSTFSLTARRVSLLVPLLLIAQCADRNPVGPMRKEDLTGTWSGSLGIYNLCDCRDLAVTLRQELTGVEGEFRGPSGVSGSVTGVLGVGTEEDYLVFVPAKHDVFCSGVPMSRFQYEFDGNGATVAFSAIVAGICGGTITPTAVRFIRVTR